MMGRPLKFKQHFAHIFTNCRDKDFVKMEWEKSTERKLEDYHVIKTSLSHLMKGEIYQDIAICILRYGRKDNEVLWVEEDLPRRMVNDRLWNEINWNSVRIQKGGGK